ncbi:hypothetical protein [Streptomyces otsuchiensis]|uniref:hypothetical protein n=1 Tax=Streptomyces otsuchiensis TaxID=2681388 RepID=UPI0010313C58|nr:hypothetical protein [Streptomyces otsuchiensis]
MGQQRATPTARDHALAVLRIRNFFLAAALVPAAVAAVVLTAGRTGHLASGWTPLRWSLVAVAALVLVAAAVLAATIARARPAVTPTIEIPERAAPALYALMADLADRLDVPAPSAIALTPDCDSWLEEPPRRRFRAASRTPAAAPTAATAARAAEGRDPAPVLVIGSPFLWWMRTPELRALLAPVVAGTGPSRHPDIAAARRCIRGLDAAAAFRPDSRRAAFRHPLAACAGRVSRTMLRLIGSHATEMERGVAAAASARARHVDQELRQVAQEQVGLAYAGWDRLLTRVALPAWRLGRWPSRLNAGVVSSLTDLSRRDRLADGFTARLGERPACDLLEEPGAVDREISLLAARLFHGPPPAEPARDGGAHRDAVDPDGRSDLDGPHGSDDPDSPENPDSADSPDSAAGSGTGWEPVGWAAYPEQIVDRLWRERAARLFTAMGDDGTPALSTVLRRLAEDDGDFADTLAARLAAATARAEHQAAPEPLASSVAAAPLAFPSPPPPSGRELLVQHIAAGVCCAATDTASGAPGLDWLDGPVLTIDGARAADLADPVHALVDSGDPEPLRAWLADAGVHTDKLVRLV